MIDFILFFNCILLKTACHQSRPLRRVSVHVRVCRMITYPRGHVEGWIGRSPVLPSLLQDSLLHGFTEDTTEAGLFRFIK